MQPIVFAQHAHIIVLIVHKMGLVMFVILVEQLDSLSMDSVPASLDTSMIIWHKYVKNAQM